MKKILVTSIVVAAAFCLLVWAARSFDLVGAIRRMHGH
jgi:hypothetical protein